MQSKVYQLVVPLFCGVAAAALYAISLSSAVAPIELLAVKPNLEAGEELTEENVTAVSLRADRRVLQSAIAYSDRGAVLGRRLVRSLNASELVLLSDVRTARSSPQARLRPGELSLTIALSPERIVPGLAEGDQVMALIEEKTEITESEDPTAVPSGRSKKTALRVRYVGPFRVIGWDAADPADLRSRLTRGGRAPVVLAVTAAQDGSFGSLAAADVQSASADDRVVGLEFAAGGKADANQ